LVLLKLIVIDLLFPLDRVGQRDQTGLVHVLR
jgi:hypothetical protein